MHAHYLQHVPFEGPGTIEPWLRTMGYQISSTRFFEATSLPRPEDVDLLVVMGGPMSVNDEQQLPWLIAEKQFIRRVIDARKAVLGVCLGAQLIANALGVARVSESREGNWLVPHTGDPGICSNIFPLSGLDRGIPLAR